MVSSTADSTALEKGYHVRHKPVPPCMIFSVRQKKGLSTHAAVLDFTKAFDKVPHALLMEKLSRIGTIDTHTSLDT